MADDFAGAQAAQFAAKSEVPAVGQAEEEPGGVKIARPGGVDDARDRERGNFVRPMAVDDDRSLFRARHDRQRAFAPHRVDRFRGEFIDLMRRGLVDTLFANSDEVLSLYQTPHFAEAVDALRGEGVLAVVTRSENGSLVLEGRRTHEVSAFPVARVLDTTGAGDLFSAGFLAGMAKGADLTTCARLGALAAAEVIQHLGARPLAPLAELARQNGLAI